MRGLRAGVVAAALCLVVATPATAAPGGLDRSFGNGGWLRSNLGATDAALGVVRLADGKTVVAGTYTERDRARLYLARYLPNGRLDTSFGSRGVARPRIGNESAAYELDVLPDGRLVVVGLVFAGGRAGVLVARFAANGQPDKTFGNGGWVSHGIGRSGLALASDATTSSDGSVAIVGLTLTPGGSFGSFVVRLQPNGKPDPLFGKDGTVLDPVPDAVFTSVVLPPDGSVVVAGARIPDDAPETPFLGRFLPNGAQDGTFGASMTAFVGTVFTALVRTREGLYVAAGVGPERGADGGSLVGRVVRFLPIGTLDPTFALGGTATVPAGEATLLSTVGVDGDGRIVVAGSALVGRTSDLVVARFAVTGQPDSTFGRNGISLQGTTSLHEELFDADVAPDGVVTVSGAVVAPRKGAQLDSLLARFLP